jgi:hypothetical protein
MFAARSVLVLVLTCIPLGTGCKKSKPKVTAEPEPSWKDTQRPPLPNLGESAAEPVKSDQLKPRPTPNPELLSQLNEEVQFSGYGVRPPKGYTLKQLPSPLPSQKSSGIGWVGQPRMDGTSPSFMFLVMSIPPGERLPTGVSAFVEFLASIRKRRTDWTTTPPEPCEIGGLRFLRAEWRGKNMDSGMPMRGFLYVAFDGRTVIQLSSQDPEPYDHSSLPIAEAAVSTFRKLSPSPSP